MEQAEADVLDAALAHYPGRQNLAGKLGVSCSIHAPSDAPTLTVSGPELTEYTGRFADPGQAVAFGATDGGLEATTVLTGRPDGWRPALASPTPPAPVAFLEKDIAVVKGARVPFIRDDTGQIRWISAGFRLIPRASDPEP